MANQVFPNWTTGGSTGVEVNGSGVPGIANFNDNLPVAPSLAINAKWLADGSGEISASVQPGNVSIAINGVPVSDDYQISINSVDKEILFNSSIPQNAHAAYVNGSPAI